MGHIKVAGMATTQNFGNTVMLRVDIPETAKHPTHTQMYGMGSIFSIKPCDEQTAKAHAEVWQVQPIMEYSVAQSVRKQAETMAQQIIDGANTKQLNSSDPFPDSEESDDYKEHGRRGRFDYDDFEEDDDDDLPL
jgi:hypothetical protein